MDIVEICNYIKLNPSAIVLIFSTFIAWKSFKTQRFLTRAKNTIDFEASYHNSKEIQDCEKRVKSSLKSCNADDKKSLALPERFSEPFVSDIRETLNIWERAAIAIKSQVYDEDVLYKAYGSSLIGLWNDLRPYIIAKQEKNRRLYANFDWLAIRWMVRRESEYSKVELKRLKKAQRILSSID